MKKWLHWQFVVPRVLALVVAMLAAQYVLGLVARSIAIQASEAAVGAHVERRTRASVAAESTVSCSTACE